MQKQSTEKNVKAWEIFKKKIIAQSFLLPRSIYLDEEKRHRIERNLFGEFNSFFAIM